jgi:NAD(P)-dependent dehydrogenase (short-subunit alcohol dehydrogenase family)
MSALTGKIVLVTGAGKGTGRAAAEAFARAGARVAANDITPINLDETVARIQAAGGTVKPYVVDIAKKLPVQGLLNQVLDEFGRLDVLVHCAEVEPRKPLIEMDEWDWVRTLDVNLTGAFLLVQSAARIMKTQGGGTIILAGDRAKDDVQHGAYAASKAGLAAFAEHARLEFEPLGIRVYHWQPDNRSGDIRTLLELVSH